MLSQYHILRQPRSQPISVRDAVRTNDHPEGQFSNFDHPETVRAEGYQRWRQIFLKTRVSKCVFYSPQLLYFWFSPKKVKFFRTWLGDACPPPGDALGPPRPLWLRGCTQEVAGSQSPIGWGLPLFIVFLAGHCIPRWHNKSLFKVFYGALPTVLKTRSNLQFLREC